MLKRVLSHAGIYGLAPYVTKLVSFFILPIITKDLTAEDYGVAGLVTGYTSLFTAFSTLGLTVILSNSFIKHEKRYPLVWRHIYGFLSIWNVAYGIIISAILFLLLSSVIQGDILLWTVFLSVGPVIFFGPTQAIGSLYFQLNKRPVQVVWRSILFGLLTIALNLYFISYLKMGFLGWFWSDFIVGLLFNFSYWWSLNIKLHLSPIFKIRKHSIRKYLGISLPVIPHQYSTLLLRSSDRAILGFLRVDADSVGKYSLAANFGNYFYSISTALGTAMNPFLLRDMKDKRIARVRILVFLAQLLLFLLTFNFSIWSKEAMNYLIRNDELKMVYPLVIIVVMAFSYRPMYLASTTVFFFTEKTKQLMKISLVAGVGNVILNFIFVPIVGYAFAAYSTFICYMYVGYCGFFLKQFRATVSVNFYPVYWIIATVGLTAIAYLSVDFPVSAKIGISGVVSGIMLVGILKLNSKMAKHDG